MRRALIVGIDKYDDAPLKGCVNDARKIFTALERNEDRSPNFHCKLLTAPNIVINKPGLKEAIRNLFLNKADVALLYFSGHGFLNPLGGILVTQDAVRYDEGISMFEILTLAHKAPIHEVVIILDCCHSGAFGLFPTFNEETSVLREGMSILAACRPSQLAIEKDEGGVFTSFVYDALMGGGSDILGKVTAASIYAYADQALGAWDQRPLFKTNVSKLLPLRRCKPSVPLDILRLLPSYFASPYVEYPLDPSFEPDEEPQNPTNQKIFADLQKLRDAGLLIPVGEDHMYYAAIYSKSCKLTHLGQFYRRLASEGKL